MYAIAVRHAKMVSMFFDLAFCCRFAGQGQAVATQCEARNAGFQAARSGWIETPAGTSGKAPSRQPLSVAFFVSSFVCIFVCAPFVVFSRRFADAAGDPRLFISRPRCRSDLAPITQRRSMREQGMDLNQSCFVIGGLVLSTDNAHPSQQN